MESINQQISDLQMSDAEEQISKLTDLLKRLTKHSTIDPDTLDSIKNLKSSKKDLIDVERFQTYDLETCCDKANEVYSNLEKFPHALEDLDRIIYGKLKQQLEEASLTDAQNLQENLLTFDLPERIQTKCDKLFQSFMKKIEHEQEVKFTEAENLIVKFIKHPNYSHFDLKASWSCVSELASMKNETFSARFTNLKEELETLVHESQAAFEKHLEKTEIVQMKKQLDLIEFVCRTSEIDIENCCYGDLKVKLLENLDNLKEDLVGVKFFDGASNRNMVHFEKFFEDLSAQLQVVAAAEKYLQEKFENEKDFAEMLEECVGILSAWADDEVARGKENLTEVLEEGSDECAKSFIANFYNLVSFEKKMPQVEACKY